MKNKLYIALIIVLVVTNMVTLSQLNRSNSYIDKVEIDINNKSEHLIEASVKIDEMDKQLNYLNNEVSYLIHKLEKSNRVDTSSYTYLTGLKETKEDIDNMEKLRAEYYLNRP